jgi:YD repeat-containing protein
MRTTISRAGRIATGQTVQYVYDALNRRTQKTYPDSTSVEYIYDLVGKVLQVNDPTGAYAFSYHHMGRLIGTTTTYLFLPNTPFSNSYSYDANSNRTGLHGSGREHEHVYLRHVEPHDGTREFLGGLVRVHLRRAQPPHADDTAERGRDKLQLRQAVTPAFGASPTIREYYTVPYTRSILRGTEHRRRISWRESRRTTAKLRLSRNPSMRKRRRVFLFVVTKSNERSHKHGVCIVARTYGTPQRS